MPSCVTWSVVPAEAETEIAIANAIVFIDFMLLLLFVDKELDRADVPSTLRVDLD